MAIKVKVKVELKGSPSCPIKAGTPSSPRGNRMAKHDNSHLEDITPVSFVFDQSFEIEAHPGSGDPSFGGNRRSVLRY